MVYLTLQIARTQFVRVKLKSMLKLGNETLISRKIKQLQAAKNINGAIFSSDSDEMLEHARSCGAEVFRRPDFYCDETKA
jgi:CMP-N-acetylneuraminic acid synthetase